MSKSCPSTLFLMLFVRLQCTDKEFWERDVSIDVSHVLGGKDDLEYADFSR